MVLGIGRSVFAASSVVPVRLIAPPLQWWRPTTKRLPQDSDPRKHLVFRRPFDFASRNAPGQVRFGKQSRMAAEKLGAFLDRYLEGVVSSLGATIGAAAR